MPHFLSNNFKQVAGVNYNFDFIILPDPSAEEMPWRKFYMAVPDWDLDARRPVDWLKIKMSDDGYIIYSPVQPFDLSLDPVANYVTFADFEPADKQAKFKKMRVLKETEPGSWPLAREDTLIATRLDLAIIAKVAEEEAKKRDKAIAEQIKTPKVSSQTLPLKVPEPLLNLDQMQELVAQHVKTSMDMLTAKKADEISQQPPLKVEANKSSTPIDKEKLRDELRQELKKEFEEKAKEEQERRSAFAYQKRMQQRQSRPQRRSRSRSRSYDRRRERSNSRENRRKQANKESEDVAQEEKVVSLIQKGFEKLQQQKTGSDSTLVQQQEQQIMLMQQSQLQLQLQLDLTKRAAKRASHRTFGIPDPDASMMLPYPGTAHSMPPPQPALQQQLYQQLARQLPANPQQLDMWRRFQIQRQNMSTSSFSGLTDEELNSSLDGIKRMVDYWRQSQLKNIVIIQT